MLENYRNHNRHWASVEDFKCSDPHLIKLRECALVMRYEFNVSFPENAPGIYTLCGGRQLGKSTCFKQAMLSLLEKGVNPASIFYLACDTVVDRKDLYQILKYYAEHHVQAIGYLFIDEVTFVKEWDLTIKALADEGLLRNVVCCLSGSDKIFLQDAIYRLPGRRGDSATLDFEIKPLVFQECLSLLGAESCDSTKGDDFFAQYLFTGGYVAAINDYVKTGDISLATYRVYQQWVIGDFLRLNKTQKNVLQVLYAIIKSYGSQVSFQSLAQHTEGLSKDTVNEYCAILERLGVISIQYAFDQNRLRAAPKKNRKVHFCDPFIARTMCMLVSDEYQRIDMIDESLLVESVVFSHVSRQYPTFYIKANGEVDIVYVVDDRFMPIEIKWRNQLRAADLKQVKKYPQACILAKQCDETMIDGVPVRPLVAYLQNLK